MLLEAGADPSSRKLDGAIPLYRVLVRAKANPLLSMTVAGQGVSLQPGHLEVVRWMREEAGVSTLRCAAANQDVDTMAVLTDA